MEETCERILRENEAHAEKMFEATQAQQRVIEELGSMSNLPESTTSALAELISLANRTIATAP